MHTESVNEMLATIYELLFIKQRLNTHVV